VFGIGACWFFFFFYFWNHFLKFDCFIVIEISTFAGHDATTNTIINTVRFPICIIITMARNTLVQLVIFNMSFHFSVCQNIFNWILLEIVCIYFVLIVLRVKSIVCFKFIVCFNCFYSLRVFTIFTAFTALTQPITITVTIFLIIVVQTFFGNSLIGELLHVVVHVEQTDPLFADLLLGVNFVDH